jgi:hypothetical protein
MRTLGGLFVVVTLLLLVPGEPHHGWSDPRTFSTDFAGKSTPRHAPTLVNRLFSDQQHWSGQRASLEELPLTGEIDPEVSRPPVLPK